MKLGSFDVLVRALGKARVRHLVVGGLAVNAHGYLRFKRDVDLVVQLAPENVAAAFAALTTWEGAEREQLRRWAQLSLEEIVRPGRDAEPRRTAGPAGADRRREVT